MKQISELDPPMPPQYQSKMRVPLWLWLFLGPMLLWIWFKKQVQEIGGLEMD